MSPARNRALGRTLFFVLACSVRLLAAHLTNSTTHTCMPTVQRREYLAFAYGTCTRPSRRIADLLLIFFAPSSNMGCIAPPLIATMGEKKDMPACRRQPLSPPCIHPAPLVLPVDDSIPRASLGEARDDWFSSVDGLKLPVAANMLRMYVCTRGRDRA